MFSVSARSFTKWLRGRKPFEGETPSDTLAAILKTDPPPVSEFLPEAPPELVRIINKTLRKDREQRYQVVKELLVDLRELKQELEFQEKMGAARPAKPLRTATAVVTPQTSEIRNAISTITDSLTIEIKRHRVAAVFGLVLLVAALAGGSYGSTNTYAETPVHFQETKDDATD